MPANTAEDASLAKPEATEGATNSAVSEPEQTPLKFSVGDVMRKAGIPESVRKAVSESKEPVKDQAPKEEPTESEPELPGTNRAGESARGRKTAS